ncbi:MAG: hypothetical protein DRH30_03210 [Deltaproteobacteria bacterium]|nr:MAG: hypothetical protein DRH30_03210 [Deltaproteobacteria bacterium]
MYREKMNELIPTHMHYGLDAYIKKGIGPGSFMRAVFENNLMNAFGCADEENRRAMFQWVTFVYNYAPAQSHGSPEIVNAWIEKGGLNGK